MTFPVVVRPEAHRDIVAARDWYDRQRPGLGDEFVAAADEFIGQIQLQPELYAAVLKGVRRGKLRRFPYVVYYRLLNDRVEILGVIHGSRDPRVWQGRT
jgi:plasmid stabilization system protein ParE